MANAIEFYRGDAITHQFLIPESIWSAGGTLFFAAKQDIDDDNTDAAAAIDQSWTDDDLDSDTEVNGVNHKVYNCYFAPAATADIDSNGDEEREYKGEFQFVPSGGDPITFPSGSQKLRVVVHFDVKRGTT